MPKDPTTKSASGHPSIWPIILYFIKFLDFMNVAIYLVTILPVLSYTLWLLLLEEESRSNISFRMHFNDPLLHFVSLYVFWGFLLTWTIRDVLHQIIWRTGTKSEASTREGNGDILDADQSKRIESTSNSEVTEPQASEFNQPWKLKMRRIVLHQISAQPMAQICIFVGLYATGISLELEEYLLIIAYMIIAPLPFELFCDIVIPSLKRFVIKKIRSSS